jgi:type VI secretion system secreted protein Hcp
MAVDMFLKIDGIDGESVASKHEKWIEVLSFSWGVSDTKAASQLGKAPRSGRVQISDFSIVKYMDKATPKLFAKVCEGSHIADVSLAVVRAGGDQQEYLKIKLTDVLISGVAPAGQSGQLPLEQISFSFGSSMVSAADERGQFETAVSCGSTSFEDPIKEPPVMIEKK